MYVKGMWLRIRNNEFFFVNILYTSGSRRGDVGFYHLSASTSEEMSVLSVIIGYSRVPKILVPHVRNRYLPFT